MEVQAGGRAAQVEGPDMMQLGRPERGSVEQMPCIRLQPYLDHLTFLETRSLFKARHNNNNVEHSVVFRPLPACPIIRRHSRPSSPVADAAVPGRTKNTLQATHSRCRWVTKTCTSPEGSMERAEALAVVRGGRQMLHLHIQRSSAVFHETSWVPQHAVR